jgi:hypothetical protein
VDIYDTSTANIDRVGAAHFPHREKKTSVATFAILLLLSPLRRNTAARGEGKKVSRRICFIVAYQLLTFFQPCQPPLPINDR